MTTSTFRAEGLTYRTAEAVKTIVILPFASDLNKELGYQLAGASRILETLPSQIDFVYGANKSFADVVFSEVYRHPIEGFRSHLREAKRLIEASSSAFELSPQDALLRWYSSLLELAESEVYPDLNRTISFVWRASSFIETTLVSLHMANKPAFEHIALSGSSRAVMPPPEIDSAEEKAHMVQGQVVDLDEDVGTVVYFEDEAEKEFVVPRQLLAQDNVDEIGVEFVFECFRDSAGDWTGRFVRTGKVAFSPESEFSDEECSPEYLARLPHEPDDDLFGP